jgi:lipopolysaccharide biosynthesis glycosyltransferase
VSASQVRIATGANDRHIPHVATLIESLAAACAPGTVAVHVLHDETVTPDMQERLRHAAHQHEIDVEFLSPSDAALRDLPLGPEVSGFPSLIWLRIWLPELLPTAERVLYLDADTLVLHDPRVLWDLDLGDHLLGAVRNRDQPAGRPAPYFNSGVLMMNLARMREEQTSQRLIDVGRSLPVDVAYPDQDALNIVCAGRWLALHPKWNAFAALFCFPDRAAPPDLAISEATVSPAILHFEGSDFAKPWNHRCVHPHRELYREYRGRTPWPLARLEGSDLPRQILARLPARHQVAISRLRGRVRRPR